MSRGQSVLGGHRLTFFLGSHMMKHRMSEEYLSPRRRRYDKKGQGGAKVTGCLFRLVLGQLPKFHHYNSLYCSEVALASPA